MLQPRFVMAHINIYVAARSSLTQYQFKISTFLLSTLLHFFLMMDVMEVMTDTC